MANMKKNLFGVMLLGGLALGGAGCKNQDENSNQEDEVSTEVVVEKTSKFDKKYKIDTRANFDLLYNKAKPFIFASMISTENWRQDFHNDRQRSDKPANSVGVGLYWLGVNKNGKLDFNFNGNWTKTREYVQSYKESHNNANPRNLTPDELYAGSIGWFENMENGRHLNELFNHLKGAELTINQFAAIASVYYNDEAIGRKLCDEIKDNYGDAKKCASKILNTQIKMNGIEPRRVHEALVYLNYDNYCLDLFELEVDGHLGTSVAAGASYYHTLATSKGLTNNNLSAAKNAICTYVVKNGHPIKYYVSKLSTGNKNAVLAFCSSTKTSIEMENRNNLYELAQSRYNSGDYSGAMDLYQQIVAQNGNSADLYNDMAITFYHLGHHTECIELCRKVLAMGEREKYMFATYNAGLAYWALGDYDNAIKNFEKSIEHSDNYCNGFNKNIYESKLQQCKADKARAQKKSKRVAMEIGGRGNINRIYELMRQGKSHVLRSVKEKQYA